MRKLLLLFVAFVFMAITVNAEEKLNTDILAEMPILHEGRVKPADTFARTMLLQFYGKRQLPNMNASEWLAEMLFDQQSAYRRPVFNIANPDVVSTLGLEWDVEHKYSFIVVSKAIRSRIESINELNLKPEEERSRSQNDLVNLYIKTLWYFDISRSLSLVLPDFAFQTEKYAKQVNMPAGQPFNYLDMLQRKAAFDELFKQIEGKNPGKIFSEQRELLSMGHNLKRYEQDKRAELFRIVPPQWQENGEEWTSPWGTIQTGNGSPNTSKLLNMWQDAVVAYRINDIASLNDSLGEINNFSYKMANTLVDKSKIRLEVLSNKIRPFVLSIAFYIASFVMLLASYIVWRPKLQLFATALLSAGLVIHIAGLVIRCVVMSRPPVATLYESILFVGIIALAFALFLEWKRHDGIGTLMGAVLGAVLQFIGFKYAAEGDSMGMLVAVLNTNFWLATHVVTITIGYGCCFIAGFLAHVYLIRRWFSPKSKEQLNSLMKNMLGVGLIALMFSVLGTILGGIWADQSWGRFWGWDPKENGAMLICLWLIWCLHGRIAGSMRPLHFALAMVALNICVALAWFGVNLLNVGLHSYGFTSGIALNLALFCGGELLFIAVAWLLISNKEKRAA